jgi:hypothetical protein
MLSEPDFAGTDSARRALKLLEERTTLQDLIARTTTNSTVGGLHVLIGGEGGWEELSDCSMVLARYGVPGLATGTLGVLGPCMSYARTIPTVRLLAFGQLVNSGWQARGQRLTGCDWKTAWQRITNTEHGEQGPAENGPAGIEAQGVATS